MALEARRRAVNRTIAVGEGLARTIEWYQSHQDWIREIRDASYLSYYDRMYTRRDQTLAWSGNE